MASQIIGDLQRNAEKATQLILATTKGDIERQIRWMRSAHCGEIITEPVPTLASALRQLSTGHAVQPRHVVSTACTSGLVALIEGAIEIANGNASSVIAMGADVATDFVRDGFRALKALSPTKCRPFDKARNGLALGSAAAGCLLTAHPQSPPLAMISGFGISNDATHMTAPDRHAGGLIRAIRAALNHAGLQPHDIDVVFAHGTGTPYNDAMEAAAIETVFLQAGASPAVTAIKGLIGHTLGAAGMIESVLAVEMLRRQIILPVVHLKNPEHPTIDFVLRPRPAKIRHILKIASGFGGMNAAIVLSTPIIKDPEQQIVPIHSRIHLAAATAASDETINILPAHATPGTEMTSPDPLAIIALRAIQPLVARIPQQALHKTGLILGTTLGCLEVDREFDRSRREDQGRFASPAAFSRTLPSTVAAELALKFHLTGPSLVLTAGGHSTAKAIARAAAWMRHFDLDYCIAGGLDWTGPHTGMPEGKRVVALLLAKDDAHAIGEVTLSAKSPPNLSAPRDDSLHRIFEWVANPRNSIFDGITFRLAAP